jgi:hypothetical protein
LFLKSEPFSLLESYNFIPFIILPEKEILLSVKRKGNSG